MALDPIAAIQTSLGINRTATKLTIGGFVVMAAVIAVMQMSEDETLTFWQLLIGLIGLIVIMMVLTALPILARRVIAWVLTACFSFIAISATGQAVTSNACPKLATATCILSFHLASSCERSPANASRAVEGTESGALEVPETGTDFAAGLILTQIQYVQSTDERVYIQFTGYERDQIVALAGSLVGSGWRVEGAEKGGERISAAAGMNEIRYFNSADAERASALAAAATGWAPEKSFQVIDLSATEYGQSAPGLLEIWISQ